MLVIEVDSEFVSKRQSVAPNAKARRTHAADGVHILHGPDRSAMTLMEGPAVAATNGKSRHIQGLNETKSTDSAFERPREAHSVKAHVDPAQVGVVLIQLGPAVSAMTQTAEVVGADTLGRLNPVGLPGVAVSRAVYASGRLKAALNAKANDTAAVGGQPSAVISGRCPSEMTQMGDQEGADTSGT